VAACAANNKNRMATKLMDVTPDVTYLVSCLAGDGVRYRNILDADGGWSYEGDGYNETTYPLPTPHHPRAPTGVYAWVDLSSSLALEAAQTKINKLLSCPTSPSLHAVSKEPEAREIKTSDLSDVHLFVDVTCMTDALDAGTHGRALRAVEHLAKWIEKRYPRLGGLSVKAHDHKFARMALDDLVQAVDIFTGKTGHGPFGCMSLVLLCDDIDTEDHEDAIVGVIQYNVRRGRATEWAAECWGDGVGAVWDVEAAAHQVHGEVTTEARVVGAVVGVVGTVAAMWFAGPEEFRSTVAMLLVQLNHTAAMPFGWLGSSLGSVVAAATSG
jgi:hypothetical protein